MRPSNESNLVACVVGLLRRDLDLELAALRREANQLRKEACQAEKVKHVATCDDVECMRLHHVDFNRAGGTHLM